MFSLTVSNGSFSICPYKNLKLLGFFEYLFGFGEFSVLLLVCPAIFLFHSYQSCFLGDFFPDGMAQAFLWTCFPWVTALGHFRCFTSLPEELHIPTTSADCPLLAAILVWLSRPTFLPSHIWRVHLRISKMDMYWEVKEYVRTPRYNYFFKENWRHKLSVTALKCMKR